MKKIATLSAAALLALTLTACDKKAPEAPKAEQTPAVQPAEKQPEATPATEQKVEQPAQQAQAEPAIQPLQATEQGAKDWAQVLEWDKTQQAKFAQLEAKMQKANQELQAKVQEAQASKAKPEEIKKQVQKVMQIAQENENTSFVEYQSLVKDAVSSIKALKFEDAEVKSLADAKAELLNISLKGAELTANALKMEKPTPEAEQELKKQMEQLAQQAQPLTKFVLEKEAQLRATYDKK